MKTLAALLLSCIVFAAPAAGSLPICGEDYSTDLLLDENGDNIFYDAPQYEVRCRLSEAEKAERRQKAKRRAEAAARRKSEALIGGAGRVLGWAFGLVALWLILYYARDAYKAVIRAHIRVRREAESDLDGEGKGGE